VWLITTQGFYSVVAHRSDPELLLARARTREDIEALATQIPGITPFEDRDADYRWRAEVTRAQWRDALVELAGAIDYDNFKGAVGRQQGMEREAVYHRVWRELLRLQHP
jgi:hypothetical protein